MKSREFGKLVLTALIWLALCPAVPGQKVLKNEDILRMAQVGFGDAVIIAKIEGSPTDFKVGLDDLMDLKKKGLSDAVIAAMVRKTGNEPGRAAADDGKTMVFVADSESWAMSGGIGGNDAAFAGSFSGGAKPQTAEVIKTFHEKCPEFPVTIEKSKSDYFVILDHEGGKGLLRKDTKIAVFDRDGVSVLAKSTRTVGGAVEAACRAIRKVTSKSKSGAGS